MGRVTVTATQTMLAINICDCPLRSFGFGAIDAENDCTGFFSDIDQIKSSRLFSNIQHVPISKGGMMVIGNENDQVS